MSTTQSIETFRWFILSVFTLLCSDSLDPSPAEVLDIPRNDVMKQGKPISRPDIVNVNRLKILGGKAKGMKIDSPDVYLRPVMAKVREHGT